MPRYATIACLAVLALVMLSDSLTADDRPQPIDPSTDPTELLVTIFDENGWTPADAQALADRAVQRLLGEPVEDYEPIDGPEFTDDSDAYLADPDSDATALWYRAFTDSGWPAEDAIGFCEAYVAQLNPADGGDNGKCLRYQVRAVYCQYGEKVRREVWVSKECWEEEVLECIDFAPGCQGTDSLWLTLPLHCGGVECAQISDRNFQPQAVPCSWGVVDCDCFYTGDEVFCDAIKTECCDLSGGCEGCPDCD